MFIPKIGCHTASECGKIKSIALIFLPLIISTSFIFVTSPSEVEGLTFRADLNQQINDTYLERMNNVLYDNGYKTEYPSEYPYEYPEGAYNSVLLIFDNHSKIYLISGNDSYLYGVWSYKIDMFTGDGYNVEKEKERILETVEEISNMVSLNYSKDSLVVDDNDLELFPFQVEFFLYSLCVAYTVSTLILYFWKGENIWKKIWWRWKFFTGFAFLTLSLMPIWPIIEISRFGRISSLDNTCYLLLIFFALLFVIALSLLYERGETKNEN